MKKKRFWIKEYLLYIFIPAYQIFLLVIYFRGCARLGTRELLTGGLIVALSILIDAGIVYLVNGMVRKLEVERELEALYNQRQTEQHYYELADRNMEEMRKVKKDFGDQLQRIYGLLEQEENDRVKEMLDDSYEDLKKHAFTRYCENSIVNSILTTKMKMAGEKGIQMEIACSVPEDIRMEMIDVCSLFSNLLDNAIEACEQIPKEGEEASAESTLPGMGKRISIHAGERGGFFVIRVENTYAHKIREGFLTSKPDEKNHGYGLKLVRQIVKKYKGSVEIKTEQNLFTVVATMEKSIQKMTFSLQFLRFLFRKNEMRYNYA